MNTDDDLESRVDEGAEIEVARYPDAADELDGAEADTPEDGDENPVSDEDPSEL